MNKQPEMTEEQTALFDKLTKLQQRVCIGVLEGKSQTQAYLDAGGKAKSDSAARASSCEILANPNVSAFMDSVLQPRVASAIMTREEALERLTMVARSGMRAMAKFREIDVEAADGETAKQAVWSFKNSDEMDPEMLDAIQELNATKDGLKIKLHDFKAAIKQLSDMQGWEAPKKISIPEGVIFNMSFGNGSDD